jgi:hypothetical protein
VRCSQRAVTAFAEGGGAPGYFYGARERELARPAAGRSELTLRIDSSYVSPFLVKSSCRKSITLSASSDPTMPRFLVLHTRR